MKRFVTVLLLCVVTGWVVADGKQPTDKKEVNAFMRLKLKNAELILIGLTTKDFQLIEEGGSNLGLLSHKAQFQLGDIPGYQTHTEQFRDIAKRLVTHAKKKNLDAAALDYVQLTLSCVQCHKHIRDSR